MAKLAFVVGRYVDWGERYEIFDVFTFEEEVTEAEGISIIQRDVYTESAYNIDVVQLRELRAITKVVYQ